jgi:aminoglycoside phosphotransferase (APT) family kinase protein
MEPTLREWIETDALPGRRIAGERTLTGGYSNHNVLVTMADGGRFVLRRYLGANRCTVEAALARRLAGVVPVPEVVAVGETSEPVMLSTFVAGRPVTEVIDGPDAAHVGREVGAVLAALGSVTFAAPGFFGGATLEPDGSETTAGLDYFVDRCLREGNADGHLSTAEQDALRDYATEVSPELAALAGSRRLVHADYNPKNLLMQDGKLTAVLDFEYAFSSAPLFDVGNMLRFPRHPDFVAAFVAGFRDGGGELPPHWRELSRALDLYSLADFLTRPVDHRYFARSLDRIRALLSERRAAQRETRGER